MRPFKGVRTYKKSATGGQKEKEMTQIPVPVSVPQQENPPRHLPWMAILLVTMGVVTLAAIAFAAGALLKSGAPTATAPMQVVIVTPAPPIRAAQAPAASARQQAPKATVHREIPAALDPKARKMLASEYSDEPAKYLFESLPLMMKGETNLLITTLVPSKEARTEFAAPFLEAKAKGQFDPTLPYRIDILEYGDVAAIGRVVQSNNQVFQILYIHRDEQELWVVEPLAAAPGSGLSSIYTLLELRERSLRNRP